MKSITEFENRRILVIDDKESIHEDFRQILSDVTQNVPLERARAAVFGQDTGSSAVAFNVDCAFNGHEGLEKLTAEQQEVYRMVEQDKKAIRDVAGFTPMGVRVPHPPRKSHTGEVAERSFGAPKKR